MLLEFRVPLPYCVEDPNVGYLYMCMQANLAATGGGEGVDWIKNEPYDNTDGHIQLGIAGYSVPKNKGQYSLKHYLVSSKFPSWMTKILPRESMTLVEEAWMSDDYRFAVITNQFLSKDRFHIVLESKILNHDRGESSNVFGLSDSDCKKRYVEYYDMCDVYKNEKIPDNENLTKFHSENIPNSPLQSGWYKNWDLEHMSCHYWLLHIGFNYFGLQTIGENLVYNQQCYMNRQVERQMVVSIDEWKNLKMEDIRRLEEENRKELKEKIQSSEIAMAFTQGVN